MENRIIGFGIAGNFARHLEQAGESGDFVGIETAEEDAPKGIFPTYLPGSDTFLGIDPFSCETIRMPDDPAKPIQMEPEVALLCDIAYDAAHRISALTPTHFAAYNDCSIRIEGAPKISLKKNWGPETKGITCEMTPLDRFTSRGMLEHYSLTSFIKREGILHQYGENSPLTTYSYFYDKLTDWIVDRLNTQPNQGPLEDLPALIASADYPAQMLISIGATRYTPYGESHYLQAGDRLFVILYDHTKYTHRKIREMAEQEKFATEGISLLMQQVKPPFRFSDAAHA